MRDSPPSTCLNILSWKVTAVLCKPGHRMSLYICKTFPQVKDTPHQYVIVFVIICYYPLLTADGNPRTRRRKLSWVLRCVKCGSVSYHVPLPLCSYRGLMVDLVVMMKTLCNPNTRGKLSWVLRCVMCEFIKQPHLKYCIAYFSSYW